MTVLVSPPSDAGVDDGPAIAELHRLYAVQREAFVADPYPDATTRKGHLGALAGMMMSHREEIRAAMRRGLRRAPGSVHRPGRSARGRRPRGVRHRAADSWMAEDERPADPAFYGTARAGIRYQPKGVVGNIVPWNFPFDLSVGPLVEMLAAGNRVIIKPSDYTPACARAAAPDGLRDLPRGLVAVSVGGLTLAKEFPTLRWDHLLYTGSPAIGREVALAAAREPGARHPRAGRQVPGHPGRRQRRCRERAQRGRHQAHQERPDVHLGRLRAGPAGAGRRLRRARAAVPDRGTAGLRDLGGLHRHHHRAPPRADRGDAGRPGPGHRARGWSRSAARATPRPGDCRWSWSSTRPTTCASCRRKSSAPSCRSSRYDDLATALAEINAGERPLALYVYSKDAEIAENVLRRQRQVARASTSVRCRALCHRSASAGSGQSGSGRHHGIEGFREFSNPRGVVVRGTGDLADAFLPPYGPVAQAIVDSVFEAAAGPAAAPGID